MNRNNFILVILFLSFFVEAQDYNYSFITFSHDEIGVCDDNSFSIEITDNNGIPNELCIGYNAQSIIGCEGEEETVICSISETTCESIGNSMDIEFNNLFCDIFTLELGGCAGGFDGTYRIIPDDNFEVTTPNPGSDNTRDEITLEATPGYHPLVYNWQYFHPTTNQWAQFPEEFLGESSITFTAEDLFGSQASSFVGVSIQYKLELCNGWSPMSSPYIYVFIQSSPQLLDFQEQDTSCSYTSDGSFSMILDRDLGADKKLVASLFYEFTPNTFSLLAQKDTTSLVDNGNGTFTYNWPTDTPILPGRYKVRYQTFDTSTPNPVWDSLEGTEGGFEIGNPPPVTFEGAILNQVFCHDGNDARIRLEANGGVGNYEYQINSGSWQPFIDTSVNATQLINANAGSKNIKIKDGNGCTQRI